MEDQAKREGRLEELHMYMKRRNLYVVLAFGLGAYVDAWNLLRPKGENRPPLLPVTTTKLPALQESGVLYHHEVMDSASGKSPIEGPVTLVDAALDGCVPFLISHDWAAMLRAASVKGAEVASGDVRLPFPRLVVELEMVPGYRVVLSMETETGFLKGANLDIFVNVAKGVLTYPDSRAQSLWPKGAPWLVLSWDKWRKKGDLTYDEQDLLAACAAYAQEQFRAFLVLLEAGVLATEHVEAPRKLNKARARSGKKPLPAYNRVVLAPRFREAAKRGPSDGTGSKVRLHLRRGHWWPANPEDPRRRYHEWGLVGDESLGFAPSMYYL